MKEKFTVTKEQLESVTGQAVCGQWSNVGDIVYRKLGEKAWQHISFVAEGNAPNYLVKLGMEMYLQRNVTVRQMTYNNFEVNDGEHLYYATVLP